jgi:hypothetical protein
VVSGEGGIGLRRGRECLAGLVEVVVVEQLGKPRSDAGKEGLKEVVGTFPSRHGDERLVGCLIGPDLVVTIVLARAGLVARRDVVTVVEHLAAIRRRLDLAISAQPTAGRDGRVSQIRAVVASPVSAFVLAK